jgi:hypothetical protein
MEDFKQLEVNHIVMQWFVTQAINVYHWTEAKIHGRPCLLYFKTKEVK